MNILYITRKHPPSIGGMQTQSYDFFEAISKKSNAYIISWGHSQLFLPFFMLYCMIKAAVILSGKRIDVIQLGDLVLSPAGLILKTLFKKPVLTVSHGKDSAYKGFLYELFVLKPARKLDRVICVSGYLKSRLCTRNFPEEKLTVIPNGISQGKKDSIDISKQGAIAELESRYGISLENKKIILSISRLVAKKGIEQFIRQVFINIIKEEENVLYLVAGDGPEKTSVMKAVNDLNLQEKVFLTGYIEHNSYAYKALFKAADVFIMPNIRVKGDAEGFGLTALEAASAVLPVIAYKVDGISEAIYTGKNGILIDEGDHGLFASTLISFLKDTPRSQDFGKAARDYVFSHFNWNKVADMYIDEYNFILNRSKNV